MGYNVYLCADLGGEDRLTIADCGGYTFNVAPMFRLVFGADGLYGLDGEPAGECAERIGLALAHMTDPANEATYRALDPPNGWGSHEGATEYLGRLLAACREHPGATVRVT